MSHRERSWLECSEPWTRTVGKSCYKSRQVCFPSTLDPSQMSTHGSTHLKARSSSALPFHSFQFSSPSTMYMLLLNRACHQSSRKGFTRLSSIPVWVFCWALWSHTNTFLHKDQTLMPIVIHLSYHQKEIRVIKRLFHKEWKCKFELTDIISPDLMYHYK